MRFMRKTLIFLAGLAVAGFLVSAQYYWLLKSPQNLQKLSDKAAVSQSVAQVLPQYAASKLPNPEEAKRVFELSATPGNINAMLGSLYQSMSTAYQTPDQTVTLDLHPILQAAQQRGFEIPPGTALSNDTVQISNMGQFLHRLKTAILPSLLLSIGLLAAVIVVSRRRNVLKALAGVALVAALAMVGLFATTMAAPPLTDSLLKSSQIDATLLQIIQNVTHVIADSLGHYYLVCSIVLGLAAAVLSISSTVLTSFRRPAKKHQHSEAQSELTDRPM